MAARTYALYRIHSGGTYLTDDTRSQVYGGLSAETARSRSLINATRGEVLVYEGKILPAYYSSTCGGITARASEVFKGSSPLPVDRNQACGYCTASPFYLWRAAFTLEEIRERLEIPASHDSFEVGVTAFDARRRASEISVLDGRGGIIKRFPANTFRFTMNRGRPLRRSILSTLIDRVEMKDNMILISGRGWGHGVGLCQYGAQGLAEKGKSYREILEYYYKDAEIAPDYGGL